MPKVCNFKGGKFLTKFEGQLNSSRTEEVSSEIFFVPLKQGFSEPLRFDLNISANVKIGEIIARNDSSISSPVHSPVNGKIIGIHTKGNAHFVKIKKISSNESNLKDIKADIEKLSTNKIEELLYISGVTALDNEGIPTSYKSSIVTPSEISNIIIHNNSGNAYEIPYKTFLNSETLSKIKNGIKILRKIMPNAKITFIYNKNTENEISEIKNLSTKFDNLIFKSVTPKYPASYDEILSSLVVDKKFPYGFSPANIGIIILKIQTLFYMSDAVTKSKPLIQKKIALLGQGFKENYYVYVKIGTPLETVLKGRIKYEPMRFIKNNLISGEHIDDYSTPIDKTFDSIIAIPKGEDRKFLPFIFSIFNISKKIDSNLHGEKRPCIQCGYCIDVCPASIIPVHTYRLIEANEIQDSLKSGLFNCINCNLCSYVCPSKIPLSKTFKTQNKILNDEGINVFQLDYSDYQLKGIEEYKRIKNCNEYNIIS